MLDDKLEIKRQSSVKKTGTPVPDVQARIFH